MPKNKPNIKKLQNLFNIFINDVSEEYFENLQKIYKILQKTLLNKEYVKNLTEEKLDVFVDENKELLRYFEYFGFNELRKFTENNLKTIENFDEIIKILNKNPDDEDIKYEIEDEDLLNELIIDDIREKLYPEIFTNLIYPEFNHYNNILIIFKIKTKYEHPDSISVNFITDIDSIDNIFKKYKNYNSLFKNIPTGILFYHFCKWYSEDYIEKIQIENYFTIKNIELPNFNSNEIYLLGENGAGKTILLQSIFYALTDKEFEISLIIDKIEKFSTKCFPFTNRKINIYASGVHRNRITTSREGVNSEFYTLFSNDQELNSPIKWLLKLKLKELKQVVEGISFKTATEMFYDLLEKNIEIKVRDGKILFTENNSQDIQFYQLATGYQTVLIWVIDLIIRMSENQKHGTKLQDFKGTVLIDELDLFLHPTWAYKIMDKLRTWFPRVRFIISTHSPVLILGASEDAIIYKVYKNKDGNTQVSEPYKFKDYKHLTSNAFLTAPFMFDLPFSGTREMKDKDFYKNQLDTSDSYLQSLIYKKIQQATKNNKEEQLSEDEIEKIIDNAINQIGGKDD